MNYGLGHPFKHSACDLLGKPFYAVGSLDRKVLFYVFPSVLDGMIYMLSDVGCHTCHVRLV